MSYDYLKKSQLYILILPIYVRSNGQNLFFSLYPLPIYIYSTGFISKYNCRIIACAKDILKNIF